MHVSIIGGGIMGLSVARSLLKKGIQVRLFEQFSIPNPKGSSHDHHRLIRYPYGAYKGYMLMVKEAYKAWDSVWEDIHAVHYRQTGTLVTSHTGEGWAKDSLDALKEANIPLKLLHADQLPQYIPLFPMENVKLAYYLESGGVLFAQRILESLNQCVQTNGAVIHEHTKVAHIDENNNQLQTADGSTFSYEHLVVTAGPWTKDLFPELSITPSQQTVYYLDIPDGELPVWQQAPMLLDIDPDSGFYLVPPVGGFGLKIGDHRFTLANHPDNPAKAKDHEIPNIPYPTAYPKTCFYTIAPNEEFIYKQQGDAHILTGFSGHGFKFGPVVGEQFAEMITNGLDATSFAHWLAGM